ncbi:hypothetical protein AGMMS49942_17620 [Spirochaetia bacterium]|nr:hypothetical protein AGMMS49942_17620 [Spirochaetia bacterium]
MEQIKRIVRVGQIGLKSALTKEELKRIRKNAREAAKYPINLKDFPEASPEALDEFAAMARELRKNKKNVKPVIALRIAPETLKKYKSLGKGYTGIMADVLDYVAQNPEMLAKVQ